ncbi:hypothetical protein [Nostoc sp. C117]|uniref:hypothetical protein n=1 Tax=Nostoc sp. C117 TaxID=3349875 RepID=UPI00370D6983
MPAECEQMHSLSDAYGGLRLGISRAYSDSLFGDSQKPVAVVGEAESALFNGC